MADRNITLSLNVRPDMSPAQAALRSMAADLGRAAQSTDHLRAGLKMPAGTVAPTVDQAQAAVEQLNAASAARQQTLATALEAMDPARIKELTTQTLGLEVAHKRLTEALQVEREAQTGLSVAQEQVNAGLEGMQRSIDLANAALEPDALKRRIALTLELRKAQGELADAIAREEGGFLGVLGAKVGGRLGQILTLAGKAIKAVSGLGEATAPPRRLRRPSLLKFSRQVLLRQRPAQRRCRKSCQPSQDLKGWRRQPNRPQHPLRAWTPPRRNPRRRKPGKPLGRAKVFPAVLRLKAAGLRS